MPEEVKSRNARKAFEQSLVLIPPEGEICSGIHSSAGNREIYSLTTGWLSGSEFFQFLLSFVEQFSHPDTPETILFPMFNSFGQ